MLMICVTGTSLTASSENDTSLRVEDLAGALLHHSRAVPVRTVREATPLSARTLFAPRSRVDLPDVAATGAHATYV